MTEMYQSVCIILASVAALSVLPRFLRSKHCMLPEYWWVAVGAVVAEVVVCFVMATYKVVWESPLPDALEATHPYINVASRLAVLFLMFRGGRVLGRTERSLL